MGSLKFIFKISIEKEMRDMRENVALILTYLYGSLNDFSSGVSRGKIKTHLPDLFNVYKNTTII